MMLYKDALYPVFIHLANADDGRHLLYEISVLIKEEQGMTRYAKAPPTADTTRAPAATYEHRPAVNKSVVLLGGSLSQPEADVKQNSSTDSDGETSAKIPVGTSSRVALVDALEGLSRRDEEKRLVNTYRTYIKNAQADQARLVKTRKEIARLRKEGDPNKRIPKLQQAV